MDVKRLLLVIPLAVLAYLIVVQWNQDYGQAVTPPDAPPISSSAPLNQVETEGDGEDALSMPATASDPNDAMPSPGEQETASSSRDLVAVVTDVLDLRIDPQGGDVVYAALPQHELTLDSDRPYVLLSDNGSRSYVARSGLQLNSDAGRIAYNPEQTEYRLGENDDRLEVDFTAEVNGIDVIKRFTFERNSYAVDVDYYLANNTEEPVSARFIGQLARDNSPDPSSGVAMGMSSYLGAAFSTPESRYEKVDFDDIQEGKFNNVDAQGGWAAIIQHYFVSAWVPNQNQQNLFYATTDSRNRNVAAFAGPATSVDAEGEARLGATLYMGPKVQSYLEEVAPNLKLTVDFGWLWFIANPLFWLLDQIHNLIGNWGWSIVFLTILVKLALWPLSAKAYKSMARMRKLGPEMQRLKEQYGDDRQKMSQEMMKFYQKEKINPLGGCLPILVQMPVFIALYWMLLESVELRHAPFMLWIQDLSVKDPFFILPILMGASMFVQQMLNPTPPDPMQAKIMRMLPIVFTFFFLWFPAGLVIYWVVNNMISIAQQYVITRKIENDPSIGKGMKTK
ncbi:membrane protein insertase YidC [Halomonas urumqiensis]|uniref:Membrane protein insertase YidC n=1 Tax=Halomonas urumqiensis TaxID=1684789 RepID=A0A2N7UK27_9GAMM|nr:membrane protein insertase YidC [Halomonas urumqiensis]PMR80792.1 membrane protein insertase YidC [Halomonas urumqiensis]PTB02749.1 membrane protein insertase YidC [Halomonas urumqiensis]GHE21248.1 membrane protein insertase YidC [Halomonas urumqiensis]